ncbi:MAG: hypothetical protein BJ554DRAFT_4559 [Olpidium bornovanus]|uniref:Uncharacterized protein n=1 Tax=Olpidium bornovanus TaxID=278681 RepID=A0A8H8DEU3_9FUNG|nr:MAG: hypothetical protein BJ554DRAFT_4559 [Olpidium bornovanus]
MVFSHQSKATATAAAQAGEGRSGKRPPLPAAEDWGADEEVLLIEGAELYGLGNWADIADHVGSKTTQECEKHYLDTYVASETWPLPNMNVSLDTSPEAVAARKQRQQERLKGLLCQRRDVFAV